MRQIFHKRLEKVMLFNSINSVSTINMSLLPTTKYWVFVLHFIAGVSIPKSQSLKNYMTSEGHNSSNFISSQLHTNSLDISPTLDTSSLNRFFIQISLWDMFQHYGRMFSCLEFVASGSIYLLKGMSISQANS